MTEFLLDPDDGRPTLTAALRTALTKRVAKEARALAARADVTVVFEEPRRASDLALLWFSGERSAVLDLVGDWDPNGPYAIQIAHAGPRGVRYELALYVVADSERFERFGGASGAAGAPGGRDGDGRGRRGSRQARGERSAA